MSFKIRPVLAEDEGDLKEVLYKADPASQIHPAPSLIWERWGRYYFERCRHHCFAAVREQDKRVMGVILCSPHDHRISEGVQPGLLSLPSSRTGQGGEGFTRGFPVGRAGVLPYSRGKGVLKDATPLEDV